MLSATVDPSELLKRYQLDLAVWVAPGAQGRAELEPASLQRLGGWTIAWTRVSPANTAALRGPAILLLSAEDVLAGDPSLARLARAALPGRPVVWGGTRSRDALLAAINTWRAFRVLPADASPRVLLDAIDKAHEAAQAEYALDLALAEYQQEQRRLGLAVARLRQAQDEVLRNERFAMVGRATSALLDGLSDNFAHLEALGSSLQRSLLAQGQLDSLYRSAMDGLAATCALLSEMAELGQDPTPTGWSLDLRDQPLAPLLERVVAFCRFDALAQQRSLVLSVADATLAARVDRNRLFPALLNLIRNALEATASGGRVECRLHRDGTGAVIEVSDPGVGMPESVRQQLFSPFFTTKGKSGLGLGLHMAKLTVERHGGTIECDSAPGSGTTVRVRLPAICT